MDSIDIEILKLLQKNARVTASLIGISSGSDRSGNCTVS
jgi:DNA-binding Lrp family transcriptional regulator